MVATDKKRTYKNGYNNFLKFKNQYQNKILGGIQLEFIDHGKFNTYCTRPLTNFDCLLLSSLVDEGMMSKFFHHESNRYQLPKVNLTDEEIISILGIIGYEIPSIHELKALSNFDSNTLENLYRFQLDQIKIDEMTTDNFGVIGLLSGQSLLLYDEKGAPAVYRTNIKFTESWGMKQYSLQFEKNDTKEKNYLNIRFKSN